MTTAMRTVTKVRSGTSPATGNHDRRDAETVGITQFISCELLRVTVRVNRGNAGIREAMRPSLPSVDFPRLSHRINVLTAIL